MNVNINTNMIKIPEENTSKHRFLRQVTKRKIITNYTFLTLKSDHQNIQLTK